MKQENTERFCKYCEHARKLSDENEMICDRYGIVSSAHVCRHFRYDSLKREPKRLKKDAELTYVEV